MRNDKERKAFVEDSVNWSVVGEYFGSHPGGFRISVLRYGGENWYKVELMREFQMFNYAKSRLETRRGWYGNHMYEASEDGAVLGESVSITQIVNAIKEIDMGRR